MPTTWVHRGCVATLIAVWCVSTTLAQSTRPTTSPTTAPTTRPVSESEHRENIRIMLEALGKTLREHDRAGMEYIDASRMMTEVFTVRGAPPNTSERIGAVIGMRLAVRTWFGPQKNDLHWERLTIRSFHLLKDDDAVMTTRAYGPYGAYGIRFWVHYADGAWKLYDYEDLNVGVRFSIIAGRLIPPAPRSNAIDYRRDVQTLMSSLEYAASFQFERVLQLVETLPEHRLPQDLRPLLHITRGNAYMQTGDFERARESVRRARELAPAHAGMLGLSAELYVREGKFEEAIKDAETYRRLIGFTARIQAKIAFCHNALGRTDLALRAALEALDDENTDTDAMLALAAIDTNAAREAIAVRIRQATYDDTTLRTMLTEFERNAYYVALEAALAANVKRLEGTIEQRFFTAALQSYQGRHSDAAEGFRADLDTKDPFYAGAVKTRFAHEMALIGEAVKAYEMTGKTLEVFGVLSREASVTFPQWEQITVLHLAAHPTETNAWRERAEVFLAQHRYSEAAVAFDSAARLNSDPDLADTIDVRRTYAHYHAGSGLTLFSKSRTHQRRFGQLAVLLYGDRKGPELEKLIEMHRRAAPGSAELVYAEIDLALVNKQYDAAVKLLNKLSPDASSAWRKTDRLVRAYAHLRQFDRARDAAGPAEQADSLQLLLIAAAEEDARASLAILDQMLAEQFPWAWIVEDADLKEFVSVPSMSTVCRRLYPVTASVTLDPTLGPPSPVR